MEARVRDGWGEGEMKHAGADSLDALEPVLREVGSEHQIACIKNLTKFTQKSDGGVK